MFAVAAVMTIPVKVHARRRFAAVVGALELGGGSASHVKAQVSLAALSQSCFPQMRDAVKSVARLFPTAIISGRGREKVEGFVQLRELYYAGSHGMDIIGPKVHCSLQKGKLRCSAEKEF